MLRIVGRPGWWLILYFIPLVNIVIALIVLWDLAKSFSKGAGWFFGFLFLGLHLLPDARIRRVSTPAPRARTGGPPRRARSAGP